MPTPLRRVSACIALILIILSSGALVLPASRSTALADYNSPFYYGINSVSMFDISSSSSSSSYSGSSNDTVIQVSKPASLIVGISELSLESPTNFTLIIDIIKQSDGSTEKLFIENENWQHGANNNSNNNNNNYSPSVQNFTALWTPDAIGTYSVRTFLLSNSSVLSLLSAPAQSSITVAEQVPVTASPPTPATESGSSGSGTTTTTTPTAAVANYTLLVYMVGANLESDSYLATRNIVQMMNASSSPSVNVIIETGGSSGATIDDTRFIDFTKVQRFKITHGNFELLQDLGSKNMGDPSTLSDFLYWGMKNYPANKYALALWDHGGGINGFGVDDIYNSTLSLDDIQTALGDSTASSGKKFELVGFDACLMASVEVVAKVAPYSKYLAASEEIEPSWGWNFTAVIQSLNQSPQEDGKALGTVIADSYMAYSSFQTKIHPDFFIDRGLTYSVIDLSQAPALVSSTTSLGQYLQQQVITAKYTFAFEKSLQNTERYGVTGTRSSGHVDLYELTSLLAQNLGPSADTYVNDVQSALNKAVVYNVHGAAKPNSHGISIFVKPGVYSETDVALNSMLDGWLLAFNHMKANLLVDYSPPEVDVSQQNGGVIRGYIQGDNIANVTRVVLNQTDSLGNRAAILSYEIINPSQIINSSSNGLVQFTWTKQIYFLCSGSSNCIPVTIYIDASGGLPIFAYIPARIESSDFNGTIILIYEKDSTSGSSDTFNFLGAWSGFDSQGDAARELLPLLPGDKVYAQFVELDARNAGYERNFEVGPLVIGNETSLSYHFQPGTYYMYMGACHYSGLCGYSNVFELN